MNSEPDGQIDLWLLDAESLQIKWRMFVSTFAPMATARISLHSSCFPEVWHPEVR